VEAVEPKPESEVGRKRLRRLSSGEVAGNPDSGKENTDLEETKVLHLFNLLYFVGHSKSLNIFFTGIP
jgi:hypothetical protein